MKNFLLLVSLLFVVGCNCDERARLGLSIYEDGCEDGDDDSSDAPVSPMPDLSPTPSQAPGDDDSTGSASPTPVASPAPDQSTPTPVPEVTPTPTPVPGPVSFTADYRSEVLAVAQASLGSTASTCNGWRVSSIDWVTSLDHHYTEIADEKYGDQIYTGLTDESAYCNVSYQLLVGHSGVSLYYVQLVLLQAAGRIGYDLATLDLPDVLSGVLLPKDLQPGDIIFTYTNDGTPHLSIVASILAKDGTGKTTLVDVIDSAYPLESGSEYRDPIDPDQTSHEIVGQHKVVAVDSYRLLVQ